MRSHNQEAFLALVRAGLWEQDVRLSPFDDIDYGEIYRLAEEQSVIGLVSAGLEHVVDIKVPKQNLLQFAGYVLQLEQRNNEMNRFVSDLVEQLRQKDLYVLLVKGQGIAQCYERPSWRSSGDVDLLVSDNSFDKTANFLSSLSSSICEADMYKRHLPMIIDSWEVELHGTLRSGLWRRIDRVIDGVQRDVFYGGRVRSWICRHTHIFLPRADEDVVFVFAHILQHYFREGIGLRQICDWCRLLWKYKDSINIQLLEKRLMKMGVMTEWKAFASLAVKTLGMPEFVVPFFSPARKWENKANQLLSYIIETGNFGHNIDTEYLQTDNLFKRKMRTLSRMTWNNIQQISVFPLDSVRAWFYLLRSRLKNTMEKL